MATFNAANTSRFLFNVDGTQFLVTAFTARERISVPFEVDLTLASEEEIDFDTVIGKTAALTVQGGDTDRFFHGIVNKFIQTGVIGRFYLYKARLVPQIWLLSLKQDCRIFQQKTVPEIVEQVLNDAGMTSDQYALRLQSSYKQLDYCVQYRESDLDFIRRLLEEEGIFFFFEHTESQHVMVMGDGTVNYQPIPGNAEVIFKVSKGRVPEEESIFEFNLSRQILSGKYTLRDFNFEKPSTDLTSEKSDQENDNLEVYDYPGEYDKENDGNQLAQVRLQETIMLKDQGKGKSVVPRLSPGFTFTLNEHDIDGFNQEYVLLEVTHTGEQPQALAEQSDPERGGQFSNQFSAIPSSVTLRPDRRTPKPVVEGVQTAIVTGPSGEEIYTDKHGRIKVQFHWDRQGSNDENSSCWMRVSQAWAGTGWGGMFIPRIGQEVIVDFIEGDPDRPLITGRVYHGTNTPPYSLPEEKTKSTIKSNSSKGGGGCNEIRLEDKKGDEEIYIQAEKNMNVHVKSDQKTSTGNDCHLVTQRDHLMKIDRDQHLTIARDQISEITNDMHLKIGGKTAIKVGGGHSLVVGGDGVRKFQKNYFSEVTNEYYLKAMKVVIEGMNELTFKVGGNFVKIDPSGVIINGTIVKINSGGSAGSGSSIGPLSPTAPIAAIATGQVTAGMSPQDAAAHDAPAHQPDDDEEKEWIELELVDEDDNPVPNEKYRITLPDGQTVAQGTTDERGIARVTGIDPGSCQVTFPNLDKDAWEKI